MALATVVGVAAPGLAQAGDVIVRNSLKACVTVKVVKTSIQANLVLANTDMQLRTSTGDCGCMSALARYTSSVDAGGAREILQEGLISILQSGEKTLVLASDPGLVVDRKVQLALSCADPV